MKRILIIDDDPSIRLLYQEELMEEGYDVITSDGGRSVDRLVAEQKPDLILLDLKLGRRSGLDLLQDIRRESWTTPVILLTAHPTFKLDSKSNSVHACVTKNSDLTGLKQQITKCLDAPQQAAKSLTTRAKDPRPGRVKPGRQLEIRFHE
ncbi:MAG: response regulator [Deltaproteobacteria bacterium]